MSRHETRNQAICDECNTVSLKLSYRNDFGVPTRLCRSCVAAHDNHPIIVAEREFHEAMESDRDDF
jgi:hypothetical protein